MLFHLSTFFLVSFNLLLHRVHNLTQRKHTTFKPLPHARSHTSQKQKTNTYEVYDPVVTKMQFILSISPLCIYLYIFALTQTLTVIQECIRSKK